LAVTFQKITDSTHYEGQMTS